MRVVILGSGTSIPSTRRASPAVLVESHGALALVDSGPGALRQLAHLGVRPNQLSDLCYTHAHPDHTSDLWPLLFVSRNPAEPREHPLRLHGAAGFFDYYHRVKAAIGPWAEPGGYALEEVVHGGEPVVFGGGELSAHRVPHIASSVAFRFAVDGRTLVISGDTDYGPGIVEAARGADVLVLECATPDGLKMDGHVAPALCARIAVEAAVGKLVLTHFYPAADTIDPAAEVRRHWSGEVVAAEDFLDFAV